MGIQSIEMIITLSNGRKVNGYLSAESDQRWGGRLEDLGECVRPMEAMHRALGEEGHWHQDEEEE